MPYDRNCPIWQNQTDNFFRDLKLRPLRQEGPHCVETVLAMLTGATPDQFQGQINTQDPISWSDALKGKGMQLAYCPTDVRKLRFYMSELVALDDLFTLSYFTPHDAEKILGDPNDKGWVCGSHIVVLHRDNILDPSGGTVTSAEDHSCNNRHTKRIFRVVPVVYPRYL